MLNDDIPDLFERVDVGTQVVVMRWRTERPGEADLLTLARGAIT